jgi:hypothetical protein
MTTALDALKERRVELERQIAHLRHTKNALYTPGITLIAGDHPAAHEFDQEIAQLESSILEIDAEISAASEQT